MQFCTERYLLKQGSSQDFRSWQENAEVRGVCELVGKWKGVQRCAGEAGLAAEWR